MARRIKSFRLISTHRQAPALGRLGTVIRQALVEEARMTALEDVVPYVVQQVRCMAPSYPVFVKCGCVEMHAVADGTVDVLPVQDWKTKCDWTFGLADFAPVQVR